MKRSVKTNRRGQVTTEYGVLAAVMAAAAVLMGTYLQHAKMGGDRDSANRMGEQFHPYHTTSHFDTAYQVDRNETLATNGQSKSLITAQEKQHRMGNEHVTQDLESEKVWK